MEQGTKEKISDILFAVFIGMLAITFLYNVLLNQLLISKVKNLENWMNEYSKTCDQDGWHQRDGSIKSGTIYFPCRIGS